MYTIYLCIHTALKLFYFGYCSFHMNSVLSKFLCHLNICGMQTYTYILTKIKEVKEASEGFFMNSPVCLCLKVTNKQKALVTHLGFVKTLKYPHSTLSTPSVGFYACSWRHNRNETAECGQQHSWFVQNSHTKELPHSQRLPIDTSCIYTELLCHRPAYHNPVGQQNSSSTFPQANRVVRPLCPVSARRDRASFNQAIECVTVTDCTAHPPIG